MDTTGVCAAASSLLPKLEAVLGVSVAINLAYLNLPAFGYIERVKKTLSHRLELMDKSLKGLLHRAPWFSQIDALANVETLELRMPSITKPWVPAPGVWGFLYNLLFYWRVARAASVLSLVYALVLLLLGAGHDSCALSFAAQSFNKDHIGAHFFWSCMTIIWPILMVVAGTYITSSAARFVDYQTRNLEATALSDADQALTETERAVGALPPHPSG